MHTDPIKAAGSHLNLAATSCKKDAHSAKKETLKHLGDAAAVLFDANLHDLSHEVEALKLQISEKQSVPKTLASWETDILELKEKIEKSVLV